MHRDENTCFVCAEDDDAPLLKVCKCQTVVHLRVFHYAHQRGRFTSRGLPRVSLSLQYKKSVHSECGVQDSYALCVLVVVACCYGDDDRTWKEHVRCFTTRLRAQRVELRALDHALHSRREDVCDCDTHLMTQRLRHVVQTQYTLAPSSAERVCFSSQLPHFPQRRQRTIASNLRSLSASYFSCNIRSNRAERFFVSISIFPTSVPSVRARSSR